MGMGGGNENKRKKNSKLKYNKGIEKNFETQQHKENTHDFHDDFS